MRGALLMGDIQIGILIGCLMTFLAGLMCIICGLLIWKKQKVSLLHDYHCRNVQEEDVPAYTKSMGIGLVALGAGLCLTGALLPLESFLSWIPAQLGMVTGLAITYKAQKKYNGSVL